MAGSSPTPRAAAPSPTWPRDLHRAAVFLAASGTCYWFSYALQGSTIWLGGIGGIYLDVLLAWFAVLLNVATWPDLYSGLRGLKAARPSDRSAVLAWRAFLLTIVLVVAGLVFLPLRYHATTSTETWLLVLYVSAFPFLGWTFVPILALHGILFGRVGDYLRPWPRAAAQFGAGLLFAVAAATTVIILQNPDGGVFLHSWAAGRGLMPAAAALGYLLIAGGLTDHAALVPEPERKARPTRGWALAKTPGARISPERAVYHR